MVDKMLEQTCRTCLATCGELVSIFSNDYYVHNLPDKLFHTTRIEVLKNDDLPKMMCKKCIFLVDSLYCFKDQCEMAEIKLKKTLKGTLNNDITSSQNTPSCNDRMYDSFILGKADDHSDAITSSEDEYHIEYASEEARLEVENARRRSRNARNKRNKHSGVKVKSVEILATESKGNIYRNLSGASYKYEVSEFDEDINISSDDRSSVYISEESKQSTNKTSHTNNYDEQPYTTTEKIHFFKNLNINRSQNRSGSMKPGFKRKLESDNNYNQLTKVPKKVMFKGGNEDLQCIDITDKQPNRTSDNKPIKTDDDLNTVVQINVIENSTGKVVQNYDIPINDNTPRNTSTALATFELPKKAPDENTKKILELRMENLIRQVVLNIPEFCTICSEYFDSYLDVLKHKINAHLNSNQEFFFCPVCHEKFFSNSNLSAHLDRHKNVQSFICCICSGSFYTEESLRSHLPSHVNLRDLKCEVCSKKFQRIHSLLSHCDQHISIKQLTCMQCPNTFANKELLQRHIKVEHGRAPLSSPREKQQEKPDEFECETCGEKVAEAEMETHANCHTIYPCPYCERTFNVKLTLREHVFTHLGVQPFTCLVCEKTFASQEDRTQHMQEHMKPQQQQQQQQQKNDRKKFRCRVCHEILVSRVAYGQHLKDKHWNAKQTSEILKELSESSLNEKINESSHQQHQPSNDLS